MNRKVSVCRGCDYEFKNKKNPTCENCPDRIEFATGHRPLSIKGNVDEANCNWLHGCSVSVGRNGEYCTYHQRIISARMAYYRKSKKSEEYIKKHLYAPVQNRPGRPPRSKT